MKLLLKLMLWLHKHTVFKITKQQTMIRLLNNVYFNIYEIEDLKNVFITRDIIKSIETIDRLLEFNYTSGYIDIIKIENNNSLKYWYSDNGHYIDDAIIKEWLYKASLLIELYELISVPDGTMYKHTNSLRILPIVNEINIVVKHLFNKVLVG